MAIVVEDVINGAGIGQDQDKYTATRVFIVSELQETGAGKLEEAISLSQIPIIGAQYISRLGGQQLICVSRNVSTIGSSIVKITCNYEPDVRGSEGGDSEGDVIEVGSTLQSAQTSFDKDGNLISLTPEGLPEQTGLVDVQVPNMTIFFSRIEDNPDPELLAFQYVGKVNSTRFQNLEAGNVLCTNISGNSNDGGKNYNMRYEFQVNQNSWKKTVYYEDENGKPFADATIDNGKLKIVEIYKSIDFNALGLIKKEDD